MKRALGSLLFLGSVLLVPSHATAGVLDLGEERHLVFMREEEKLARDVYLTLASRYPQQRTFTNIGVGSEQTHTDAVRDTLALYGIADPNASTNDVPASIGVFTGAEYGAYFTMKYHELVARGWQSELDALYVGALIEELDMIDIVGCPKVIVEGDDRIGADQCGLEYTDEPPLRTLYTNLIAGSQNHLRAFVRGIERWVGYGTYRAQILTQEEVDAILGR